MGSAVANLTRTDSTHCTQRTEGPCVFSTCGGRDGGLPVVPLSAGSIEVSGATSCALIQNPAGYFPCNLPPGRRFWDPDDGGRLSVSATGGEIPAFTASIEAPRISRYAAPPEDDSILIGEDLVVRWIGGSGRVVVSINATSAPLGRSVSCEVDAAMGAFIVPASALAAVGPTAFATIANVSPVQIIRAGEHTVGVSAIALYGTFDVE